MSRSEREPFNPFGEHGTEQAPKVKDSWLDAVVEGYALWPERLTPGVSIFATEAILNDPPKNWNDFLTSTLTSRQTSKLEAQLRPYHKKDELPYDSERGIASLTTVFERVSHRDNPPPDDASSVQLLWMDTTDYVGNRIIDLTVGSRFYTGTDGELDTLQAEQVFANPELLDLDRAKTVIGAAKRGLLSTEGLELAELGKLGGLKKVKPGDERHKKLIEKYMQRHEELMPYEQSVEFFKHVEEVTGEKHTPMTKEQIFSQEGWHFRHTRTFLVNDVIKRSIENEGLGEQLGSWDTY